MIWTPIVNEKLFVRPDEREEALEYDKYSIGIFKKKEDGKSELVGHAPQELSSLLYHFLKSNQKSFIRVTVLGKRKREIGLVVPVKYDCFTSDKRISSVLDEELKKRKIKYQTLEVHHQKKKVYRTFPVFEKE